MDPDPDHQLLFRVFQNPVIFEIVSGYLDLEDLKYFRCAHSGFNEASLPVILKRTATVELTEEDIGNKDFHCPTGILRTSQIEPGTLKKGIRSLTTLISNSSRFPCSKFLLSTGVFSQEQLDDDLLLDKFLSAISGFATELELQKDYFDRSFYCDSPTLNVQFERLRKLQLVCKGNASCHTSRTIPIADRNKDLTLFAKLFANSPNLTTLQIAEPHSDEQRFITPCLDALQGSQWLKISNLSLTGIIEPQHFAKLEQLGVKLRCLSVAFRWMVTSLKTFHGTISMSFLESQSSTLEQLTIDWPMWKVVDFTCAFSFPCMSKLKRLSVVSFQKNTFPGFSFVEQFPALEHLSLERHSSESMDFFPSEMQPLTTVTTLELPGPKVTPEVVEQTARVFPRVKTLTIYGKLTLLQSVNAHMANVTELIINCQGNESVLQALSGYTKAELNNMQKTLKQNIREIVPDTRKPLPIFKRLKVLRLRRFLVDDFMCEHGLLKCASLVTLDLMESEFSQISQSVLARMRQQFKVHLKPKCVIADNSSSDSNRNWDNETDTCTKVVFTGLHRIIYEHE